MKAKTEIASQVIARIFKNSGAYSEQRVKEIAFHLTDWISDLAPFVDFLENPEEYGDEKAMQVIIGFLVHAPEHLKLAAGIVLEPED